MLTIDGLNETLSFAITEPGRYDFTLSGNFDDGRSVRFQRRVGQSHEDLCPPISNDVIGEVDLAEGRYKLRLEGFGAGKHDISCRIAPVREDEPEEMP